MPDEGLWITRNWAEPGCHTLAAYLGLGGYDSLRKAVTMHSGEVISGVDGPCIDGRGGAHFPTSRKWTRMPKDSTKPHYLVVNADEGEPGTFKDRHIMEKAPHRVVEGAAIAAYAMGISTVFIYVRGEYVLPLERMRTAVEEARKAGFLGERILGSGFSLRMTVMRGAGAYICGEETGMLSSMEGGKGFPRLKPPYPAFSGLYGCPTMIDNVETLAYIPGALLCGKRCITEGKAPGELGCPALFCVSGHVERPGVYELPIGSTAREIIYGPAGGVRDGATLKAVIPGGSSSGVLAADEIDAPMSREGLARYGAMMGTLALVVMDESVSMLAVAQNLAKFYAHETCGQCTPCREGCDWMAKLLGRIARGHGRTGEVDLLLDVSRRMSGRTICAFAEGAAQAISSIVKKFRQEFTAGTGERHPLPGAPVPGPGAAAR